MRSGFILYTCAAILGASTACGGEDNGSGGASSSALGVSGESREARAAKVRAARSELRGLRDPAPGAVRPGLGVVRGGFPRKDSGVIRAASTPAQAEGGRSTPGPLPGLGVVPSSMSETDQGAAPPGPSMIPGTAVNPARTVAPPGVNVGPTPPTAPGSGARETRPIQRPVFPIPAPYDVSPGSESEYRGRLTAPPITRPPDAEESQRELQPGAGEVLIPPPPIPPVPPVLRSINESNNEARTRPPVTLADLEKMAVQYNPTLKQARALVEANFGTAIQNGLWPDPTLTFANSSWGSGGLAGTPQLMVTQDVITAGKYRLARASYLEVTKASQWNAMAVEYRVLNDIRRMFFQTLGWQAMVMIEQEILKSMEDEVVTAREAYNMGVDNLQALHLANAALQDERLTYMKMNNSLRMYWQKLMAYVGTQLPFTFLGGSLQGDTTPLEWVPILQRLYQYSPELMATYADLRYDQINLKLQRVIPWPNIQLVGGTGYKFSNDTTVGIGQISLLGVPTWNWNQGNIRRANAQILRQQAEIRRVQLTLQEQLALVYQSYITANQYVESYEKVNLPELRRAYELTLDSYEDDRVDWPIVLTSQRLYFQARRDYISYLVAWRESEVLIMGFLLSGALSPVPSGLPTGEVSVTAPTPTNASIFVAPGNFIP